MKIIFRSETSTISVGKYKLPVEIRVVKNRYSGSDVVYKFSRIGEYKGYDENPIAAAIYINTTGAPLAFRLLQEKGYHGDISEESREKINNLNGFGELYRPRFNYVREEDGWYFI